MSKISKNVPRIEFIRRNVSAHTDYISIFQPENTTCSSHLGRIGGKNELRLADDCLTHGMVIHELLHALGLWHEHSRYDRDTFVGIIWPEIKTGGSPGRMF